MTVIDNTEEELVGVRDVFAALETRPEIYRPGTPLGDDTTVPAGQYAILLGGDESFAVVGTPEELRRLVRVLDQDLAIIEAEEKLALDAHRRRTAFLQTGGFLDKQDAPATVSRPM